MNRLFDELSIKEFVESGYLQEINRKILNPCGLSLCFGVDEKGEWEFKHIFDTRKNPRGTGLIQKDLASVEAINGAIKVELDRASIAKRRLIRYGWVEQPLCTGEPFTILEDSFKKIETEAKRGKEDLPKNIENVEDNCENCPKESNKNSMGYTSYLESYIKESIENNEVLDEQKAKKDELVRNLFKKITGKEYEKSKEDNNIDHSALENIFNVSKETEKKVESEVSKEPAVKPIKYMPIKDFLDLGYLQEVNRQLLHLCGLALEVSIDDETGEHKLSGVWDYRDDPEGMVYGDLSKDDAIYKKVMVEAEMEKHVEKRYEKYNWIEQPINTKIPNDTSI